MNPEKLVLASCLKHIKMVELLAVRKVTKDQFSAFDHQKLFEVVQWVHRKYKSLVTEPVLKQLLERSALKGQEDHKRILLLFHELSQVVLPDSPPEFIVDQLVDKYIEEKLSETLRSTAVLVRDKNIDGALSSLKSMVTRLTTFNSEDKLEEGYIGDDAKQRFQNYLDKKNSPGTFGGLSTGYSQFDNETNGLQKGQVVVVMGAPKSAKSIFLINVAYNAVKNGKRVLFVVNEGGRDLVLRRFASLDAGINYTNLRDGKLSAEEEAKYKSHIDVFDKSRTLHVCSIPPVICTTSLIASKMEDLSGDGKFDLVIIDYMGLMESDNAVTRKEEDWKKLGSIALELKSMAMVKQVPILTVFHVSREGHKKKGAFYGMTDISRSWEILKTIDMLISWRVDNPDEFDILHSGSITLKIAASRDSAPALIELWADLHTMSIKEKPSSLFSVDQSQLVPK